MPMTPAARRDIRGGAAPFSAFAADVRHEGRAPRSTRSIARPNRSRAGAVAAAELPAASPKARALARRLIERPCANGRRQVSCRA